MRNIQTIWAMTRAFTVRYFRDKVALFFTLLFPIIFLFVFGTIFNGGGGPDFNVSVINKSETAFAAEFVNNLDETELFTVDADNPDFAASEEKIGRGELDAIIELPEDFGVVQNESPTGQLNLFYDEGDQQLAITIQAVLDSIIENINQAYVPVTPPFSLNAQSIQTADLTQFD